MSPAIVLTTGDALILGGFVLALGAIIGYALGLADFDRISRHIYRRGPRA